MLPIMRRIPDFFGQQALRLKVIPLKARENERKKK